MLLESLIGTESKASPQFFSRLCPGPGSQALLWPVGTQAEGACLLPCSPAPLASASLVGRDLFLA